MFGMWDVEDVGYWGWVMFGNWDVKDVVCWGCGIFRMWDIGLLGCWGCGMLGMWVDDWQNSFSVAPTDSTEVSNIISSLNQDKCDGLNSILVKILKLLNKNIFGQLPIFFNQSFSSGIFPSVLKTSENIPIYKKCTELECSNYRQNSGKSCV